MRALRLLQNTRILALFFPVFLACAACGGSKPTGKLNAPTVGLPPANPQAVSKMVQGVQFSKEIHGREQGIALLREAASLDPNLWEASYDLGVVLASSGDLAGAEKALKDAAKTAQDQEDVAVALAEVRRRRGSTKLAAEGLGDFVEAFPQALQARTLYVATLRDSGQVEKAIAQGREVLTRKPGDPNALSELALCHLARGEQETARLLVKQALTANKDSAIAHRVSGLISLAAGDDAIAFQAFAEAASEDPHDTTSRLNMGTVLLRAGAYQKAEEQFRAILAISFDDTAAMVGLAAALRGEADAKSPGKYEEAKGLLEKVLDKDPHNTSAQFNLGVLYNDFLKRPTDAKPLFEKFLSDAPSDHPSRADAERYLSGMKDAASANAKSDAKPDTKTDTKTDAKPGAGK